MSLVRPETLQEALEYCTQGPVSVLAGGTDFFPALGDRQPPENVLDVTAITGLGDVSEDANGWRIGATVTWSEICRATLPPLFDGLKQAARQIGSAQIQNAATLVGNVCNASPAADGVPPLLALDASVEIASCAGTRVLDLADFIQGVRKTALKPGEIVTAICIPAHTHASRSAFTKLGSRDYLVISIAMVAVTLHFGRDQRISAARIAVGSCSPVAVRLPDLEAALVGLSAEPDALAAIIQPEHLAHLSPISDVRGSGDYRKTAALELVRRTLSRAAHIGIVT